MYTENELVRIAKRENNKKRKYLVVNRLQGKHIPVSPKESLGMFGKLAEMVESEYVGERLLLVGFAETATAVGAAIAVRTGCRYMQTTRENIGGVSYLCFSESHSHATEQKLVKTDLDKVIDETDRIVFVEDEVTTGNTIWNIVRIIEQTYSRKIDFSVASLLNGMDEEAERRYVQKGIKTHYLVKTDHTLYTEIAEGYKGDGVYFPADIRNPEETVPLVRIPGAMDARRVNRGSDYLHACESLWKEMERRIPVGNGEEILIIGSEECMYPALFTALKIEEKGNFVRCHSTTRSPITVSMESEYPLHVRYELASLYDRNRRTFIYDLAKYDKVIIVTDSANPEEEGRNSLINALVSCGNQKIYFVRWC